MWASSSDHLQQTFSLQTPISAVINHLLSRQPALAAKLAAHAGKIAAIDAGIMQLLLRIGADGLLQPAAADDTANVSIRINPADLPQVLADTSRAFAYVNIAGDAEFAKVISEVANGLRWDVEEDLAPLVGDIAAVRIAQAAREAAGTAKAGSRKLLENLAEYLLEENPMLLYRSVSDSFAADVSVLRDDVERLAKRIALLEKRATNAGGGQS